MISQEASVWCDLFEKVTWQLNSQCRARKLRAWRSRGGPPDQLSAFISFVCLEMDFLNCPVLRSRAVKCKLWVESEIFRENGRRNLRLWRWIWEPKPTEWPIPFRVSRLLHVRASAGFRVRWVSPSAHYKQRSKIRLKIRAISSFHFIQWTV